MPATSLPDYAHELVIDLLNCLIKPQPTVESTSPLQTKTTQQQIQPLLLKSGILRILSELVRSYAGCAKIVTTHVYRAGQSETITEDYNSIAFLLDNFLPSNQVFGDKDCPSLCRLLIVALASCNHCLDSQNALVHEVKLAFNRALNLSESPDKHLKVQSLATIINTMIETCPAIANSPNNNNQTNANIIRQQQQNMVNNMMKIMHKKGLINDLAHAPLYMDLSCSKCIESVNSILKPLETMSKTLNMTARKREMQQSSGSKTATATTTGSSTIATSINSILTPTTATLSNVQNAAEIVIRSSGEQEVEGEEEGAVQDEQMIDLNMTEMEPQQALPQDVDMPSVPSSRRNIDDRVLDRVIEALNQENDSSDLEYEGGGGGGSGENRIIRIQTDDNNEQIRIQIETGEDEGEANSDDEEEEGNSDEDIRVGYGNEEDDDHRHHLHHHHHHDHEDDESSTDSDEDDDEEDDDDDDDGDGEGVDEEEEEDDDENVIDEELVEGSDGRSAVPSDISDDENEHPSHDARQRSNDPNDPVSAIANAVASALESADAALDRNRDDDDEDDHDDDDDDDEDDEGEDVNEEGMDLDEDDEEIIEDEDEDDEEEEDEDDEEAIDENEEEEEDEHDDVKLFLFI